MPAQPKPITLLILDGWGYCETRDNNAIAQAHTPHWDAWWQNHPHTLLTCSGSVVGLPNGQMGNSEVGHIHMGAGRVVDQDYTRINKAIATGTFAQNTVLRHAVTTTIQQQSTLHIIGLLSPGGVHSHEQHIQAMAKLATQLGCTQLMVHAILDGRDTPPRSAQHALQTLQTQLTQSKVGHIASIIGRYYAMDRDNRWDRTQTAYDLLTLGTHAYQTTDPLAGLDQAYNRNETDEFVQSTITSNQFTPVQDNDVIVFMNFRADRARQLTRAFTEPDFNCFTRQARPKLAKFVTLTQYATTIAATPAFLPQTLNNTLGAYAAHQGLQQLRIAETEKYAHVTYFLNGGVETVFPKEERILIPSPKINTYDQQPAMSAVALTQQLAQAITTQSYDLIVGNFANADMVGHTGNLSATVEAIEVLDTCLGSIAHTIQQTGGELIITADHGNAEQMYNPQSQQAHTAHTTNPVPLLYLGRPAAITKHDGGLIDVAPTLLYLLGLPIPAEMTGQSLLTLT